MSHDHGDDGYAHRVSAVSFPRLFLRVTGRLALCRSKPAIRPIPWFDTAGGTPAGTSKRSSTPRRGPGGSRP